MSSETISSYPTSADEFYELRSAAIDRLDALEYNARMVGGEAVNAAFSDMEAEVHKINKHGVEHRLLSPALED